MQTSASTQALFAQRPAACEAAPLNTAMGDSQVFGTRSEHPILDLVRDTYLQHTLSALTTPDSAHGTLDDAAARALDQVGTDAENALTQHCVALPHESNDTILDKAQATTLASFSRAMEKRNQIAPQISFRESDLVAQLRTLGLPSPNILTDERLLNAIPPELWMALKKSLVFVLYPGRSMPEQDYHEADGQALSCAVQNMSARWERWAHVVTEKLTTPYRFKTESKQSAERLEILGITQALQRQTPTQISQALDQLDDCAEDLMRFALEHAGLSEKMHALGWTHEDCARLQHLLEQREHAARGGDMPLKAVASALQKHLGKVPAEVIDFACALIPDNLMSRILKSCASSDLEYSNAPAGAINDAIGRMLSAAGDGAPSRLAQHIDRIIAFDQTIVDQHPHATAFVQALCESAIAAGARSLTEPADFTTHIRERLLDQLDIHRSGSISAQAAHLATELKTLRNTNSEMLQSTPLNAWIARALTETTRLVPSLKALEHHAATFWPNTPGTHALAQKLIVTAHRAGRPIEFNEDILSTWQCLPLSTQQKFINTLFTPSRKFSSTTRKPLAQLLQSSTPTEHALGELFERFGHHLRSQLPPPPAAQSSVIAAKKSEDEFLDNAVAQATSERAHFDEVSRTGEVTQFDEHLDHFLADMPNRGSPQRRTAAIVKYLESRTPEQLLDLMLAVDVRETELAVPASTSPWKHRSGIEESYINNVMFEVVRINTLQPRRLTLGDVQTFALRRLSAMPSGSHSMPAGTLAKRASLCVSNALDWGTSKAKSGTDTETTQRMMERCANRGLLEYSLAASRWAFLPEMGGYLKAAWDAILDNYANTLTTTDSVQGANANQDAIFKIGERVLGRVFEHQRERIYALKSHPVFIAQLKEVGRVAHYTADNVLHENAAAVASLYISTALLALMFPEAIDQAGTFTDNSARLHGEPKKT